jgi:hypothetical protein
MNWPDTNTERLVTLSAIYSRLETGRHSYLYFFLFPLRVSSDGTQREVSSSERKGNSQKLKFQANEIA